VASLCTTRHFAVRVFISCRKGHVFCAEVVKIAFSVAAIGLVVAAAYGTASFILTSYILNADSGQYTDTLVTLEDELKITIRPTVS